jgi:hypothetical protein
MERFNIMEKKAYVAPVLEEIGSFEEITQAGKNSGALDRNYPRGTVGALFS